LSPDAGDHDALHEHVKAVHEWVERNIRAYAPPQRIRVRSIELNPETLRGKARLLLGEQQAEEELSLSVSETGWMTYSLPMFHSPLGAPASYSAVSLTEGTRNAVDRAVRSLLPRLLPLGLHPLTREWITTATPLSERMTDPAAFRLSLDRFREPDFEVVQEVIQIAHIR
jgi:hypothetical protein